MFCKSCGAQLKDGVKFCASCGAPVVPAAPGQHAVPPVSGMPGPGTPPPHQGHRPNHAGSHTQQKRPAAPRPNIKVKRTFNIANFIVWAGCALTFISLFLPFATASFMGISESVNLIDTDDGIFFIVIILITAVVNLTRVNIIPTITSAMTVFLTFIEVNDSGQLGSMVEFGAGRTLLIIGSLVMLLASIGAIVLSHMKKTAAMNAAM